MNTELQKTEKIVLVYNPSIENQQIHFTTTATTYGELKQELAHRNIVSNLDAWKVMEGRTRVTLEDAAAVLPTNIPLANKPGQTSNDLILIMTPKKIDLGATDRKTIMQELKAFRIISKENEALIRKTFGNYTQLKDVVLQELYDGFKSHLDTTDANTAELIGEITKSTPKKEEQKEEQKEEKGESFTISGQELKQIVGKLNTASSIIKDVENKINNLISEFSKNDRIKELLNELTF